MGICKDNKKISPMNIDIHFSQKHKAEYEKSQYNDIFSWKEALKIHEKALEEGGDDDMGMEDLEDLLGGGFGFGTSSGGKKGKKGKKGKGGGDMFGGLEEMMMDMMGGGMDMND